MRTVLYIIQSEAGGFQRLRRWVKCQRRGDAFLYNREMVRGRQVHAVHRSKPGLVAWTPRTFHIRHFISDLLLSLSTFGHISSKAEYDILHMHLTLSFWSNVANMWVWKVNMKMRLLGTPACFASRIGYSTNYVIVIASGTESSRAFASRIVTNDYIENIKFIRACGRFALSLNVRFEQGSAWVKLGTEDSDGYNTRELLLRDKCSRSGRRPGVALCRIEYLASCHWRF